MRKPSLVFAIFSSFFFASPAFSYLVDHGQHSCDRDNTNVRIVKTWDSVVKTRFHHKKDGRLIITTPTASTWMEEVGQRIREEGACRPTGIFSGKFPIGTVFQLLEEKSDRSLSMAKWNGKAVTLSMKKVRAGECLRMRIVTRTPDDNSMDIIPDYRFALEDFRSTAPDLTFEACQLDNGEYILTNR